MKKIGIVAFLLVAVSTMWAAGCGGTSACTLEIAGAKYCQAVTGGDTTGFDAACTAAGGTTGSCAAGLGTCTGIKSGVWTLDVTYYEGTGVTAETAKTACTAQGGTWK